MKGRRPKPTPLADSKLQEPNQHPNRGCAVRVRMDSGERKVIVWGKPHVVLVSRISNAAWEAVGDYMGEPIRVEDRSEGSAFMRWRDAAISKGNP